VVVEALRDHEGDVLVFLPGRGEIARVARELAGRVGPGVEVCELHGSVRAEEQDRLLSPHADRRRRVILATSIAETSVTLPGVRVVVDAGRRRSGEVDPRTGLAGLVTRSVSLAGADQRRGRAGREAPGACYRLWSPNDEAHRARFDPPEIEVADLAPLVLQTLAWGASSPGELRWVDPPPDHAVRRAMGVLADLDAVEADPADPAAGRLTRQGRRLSTMGLHPRLGAIAAAGAELGVPRLAAQVAAVLEVGGPGEVDLAERVRLLRRGRAPAEVARVARSTLDRLGVRPRSGAPADREVADEDLDQLVARLALAGFADRLAMRRRGRTDARGRERAVWQLRHGGEVEGALHDGEWIVACGLDAQPGEGRPGRLHLAVVAGRADVAEVLRRHAVEERSVTWDPTAEPAWAATVTTRLDAIRVATRPWREPDDAAVGAAVATALAAHGPSILARWPEADRLRSRVAFARARGIPSPAGRWPDLSEAALASATDEWLAPAVAGARGPAALARLDVRGALVARVGWEGMRALEAEVPESWQAPDGRHLPLRYGAIDGDPGSVLLSVRLQTLLGIDEHPRIGHARIPVTVEPLSPAGRPVQRTEDLPGFWRGSYARVRAEMRARYRRHDWPERPWEAGG
jgi:ATP-dependent helicase HrpB